MWYIVRLDSSRVATLVKVRSETRVSSSDPTRVKSNYIPHILRFYGKSNAAMGSGFHGMNGISPTISIHIYRTYVLSRVMYDLEGTILKSKHITKRERFHRNTMRQLQALPDRTACAVYLLDSTDMILLLEAYLDSQITTLLYMVGHDMDSSIARTALYQMSNKDSKSSSWFVYSYIRLNRYDLDPLDILQNCISKGDIRRTIRSHWFNILTDEAEEKSSLFTFMSHTMSGRQWAHTQQRLARQSSKQDSYLDPILSKPIVLLQSVPSQWPMSPMSLRVTQKTESTSFYGVRLCPRPVIDTREISLLCILNMTVYITIWNLSGLKCMCASRVWQN